MGTGSFGSPTHISNESGYGNMKIITTNADDFVRAEVDEWGFDYVEAKFATGYEPTLVNGVWCWYKAGDSDVAIQLLQPIHGVSNSSSSSLHNPSNSVRFLVPH